MRLIISLRRTVSYVTGATLPVSRVYCDNQSVIAQLRKRDLSARSRHIRVQLGFVYDALDSGEIEIRYVRSAANPANQLTAPEVADRLARTIDAMSGRPPEGPPLDIEQDA